MTISPITSGATPAITDSATAGKTAAAGKPAAGGGSGSSSGASTTVTNTTTQTNADGTITVVTTYADGTTSSTIEPNPVPVTGSNPLSGSNSGQLATLLSAQEQSQSGSKNAA